MRPASLLLLLPMVLCLIGMMFAGLQPDAIDAPVWPLVSAASATVLMLYGLLYALDWLSRPSAASAETSSAKLMSRARAI
jgi:hypothetical protein